MRTVSLLCLAVLLGACGRPAPFDAAGVRLSVQPEPPAPGDSVTLVLANRSPDPIGYNLCASQLERRAGGEWRPVPEDRVCTMELRALAPGEEARFELAVPPGLEPGEYRYTTRVENLETGEGGSVRVESFRVDP